eukprot:4304260-Prymnesium_polylepis.1
MSESVCSASQSANQPISQSANQPISQSANRPIGQSANRPIGQSVDERERVLARLEQRKAEGVHQEGTQVVGLPY